MKISLSLVILIFSNAALANIYKCQVLTLERSTLDLVVTQTKEETLILITEATKKNVNIDPGLEAGKTLSINNKTKVVKSDNKVATDCEPGELEIGHPGKHPAPPSQTFKFHVNCGAQDAVYLSGTCVELLPRR